MPTDPDIAALAHEIEGTVAPPQSKGAGDKSADGAGAAQVAAVLERERPAIAQTERERADHALWDEHFSSMTQEEIGEEISADSKAASAYAQYQERKQSGGGLSPEAAACAAEGYF